MHDLTTSHSRNNPGHLALLHRALDHLIYPGERGPAPIKVAHAARLPPVPAPQLARLSRPRLAIGTGIGLTLGVLGGELAFGIVPGLVGGIAFGLPTGLALGVMHGLEAPVDVTVAVSAADSLAIDRRRTIGKILALGPPVGLAGGLAVGAIGGLRYGLSNQEAPT